MEEIFQIFSRFSAVSCFQCKLPEELKTAKHCVKLEFAFKKAIKEKVDLTGANMRGVDLRGVDLRGAYLKEINLREAYLCETNFSNANLHKAYLPCADLRKANLSGADLHDANLSGADFSEANLDGANLSGADLKGANLSRADFHDADLSKANLYGANLDGADLSRANLQTISEDLIEVLKSAQSEARGFLEALKAGRVDGTVYKGNCACLIGTIANIRGVNVSALPQRADSPIERFVLGIAKGDTPETNPVANLVAEWTEIFIKENQL